MLLVLAAMALGLQTRQPIKLDFLPSKDMPDFQNPGDFRNSGGSKGMCNGIEELTSAYVEVRRRNPNAMPLNEIIGIIQKYHGADYLKQTMATATNMAYSGGSISAMMKNDPNQFVADVVSKMQATQRPQSVILLNPDGTSHRVTVYGATPTPTGWSLNVADITHYERNVADQVTLAVDSKTGQLTSTVAGKTAETYNQGGVVSHSTQPDDHYIDMIDMAILGKPVEEIRGKFNGDPVPVPQGALLAQKDPKTGGVLIRFDPSLFTGTVDETQLTDLNKRLGAFLDSEAGGAAIYNLEPTVKRLSLVPFSSITTSGSLGGLTRIEGFVLKPDGSAYLAGIKEPGQEPIPSEWLSVALQSEYAKGLAPYISLDPDPQTYSGPQNVRIGEIPEALRSSSFIKAMLEADYLMKRINLGKEVPKVDGFKSWVERMDAVGGGGAVRMWFTPSVLPAADSYIYRHEGSLAVLFESQVTLLSEAEKTAEETGYSAKTNDSVAEQAASDFSRHMDELTVRYPEFHRLRGVFDVSKLAVCWRALNLKPNGIEPWLSVAPPKVNVPTSYPGIGPDLSKDGKYAVSGGAVAKARFKAGATVETDRLQPMIAEAERGEAVVELPATLPISEVVRAGFEAQNLLASAQSEMRSGRFEEALSHVEQVLSLDPNDDDGLTLEATVLGFLKRYPDSIAIIDKLLPRNPDLIALRAVMKASAGDYGGAILDANRAESDFPDSEATLATSIAARLIALDADGAGKGLVKLRKLSPAHPAINTIGLQIDLIRFLGPEKARERLAMQTQIPIAIATEMQQSVATPAGFAAYKNILEKIQSGAYAVPEKLHIRERLLIALSSACVARRPDPDDLKLIGAAVDQMVADHPDWASSYFARFCMLNAIDADVKLVVGALDKFAELEPKSDPILPELQLVFRVPRLAPLVAAMTAVDPTIRPELRSYMAALAADLTKGQSGQEFFRLLGLNPKIDAGALNQAIAQGVIFGDADELTKALDRMTASAEGVSPSDAAFYPALCYCADCVQVVKPGSQEYIRMTIRAAKLASAGSPSKYLVPLAAKCRSQIWLRLSVEATRDLLDPKGKAIQAIGPVMEKMDRLIQPASSKDSLTSVATTVDDATRALGGFLNDLRTAVTEADAGIRKNAGSLFADVVELCTTEMQGQMNTQDRGELKKLADLHPGFNKTASYAAFAALNEKMAAGLFVSEPESAVWRRILVGIKTRYDGIAVQELVTALSSMGSKNKETLATYLAQCKAKTEMGTSESDQ